MTISDYEDHEIDQYKIKEPAGQDLFNKYYDAYEIDTGSSVTVSILRPAYAADEEFLQHYLHRTQSLMQIRHPNLVTYLHTGLIGESRPFVASEPVNGYPLSDRLERLVQEQSPAHSTYALSLVQQIAAGLQLLERLGFFHYELTPAHIAIRSVTVKGDDSIILRGIDIPHNYYHDWSAIGDYAAAYVSPEQLAGKGIDGRSHVYTLGVILHEMLCGERPERPFTLINSTLGGQSSLMQIRPDLTQETYELIEKSLAKNPRRRFETIAAFQEALNASLDAEEIRMHSKWTETTRRPRRLFLLPLLVLLLCGFVGVSLLLILPGRERQIASAAVEVGQVTSDHGADPPIADVSATTVPSATASPNATATKSPVLSSAALADEGKDAAADLPGATATATPTVTTTMTASATQTATWTVTATRTPFPTETPRAGFRVLASSANLRFGPGVLYDPVDFILADQELEIIARNQSSYLWLNVRTEDGKTGWVAADVGEITWPPDINLVQVAATIPPPPTATLTPTPTDTAVPPTALPQASGSGSGSSSNGGNNGGGSSGGGGGGDGGSAPRATPTPPL